MAPLSTSVVVLPVLVLLLVCHAALALPDMQADAQHAVHDALHTVADSAGQAPAKAQEVRDTLRAEAAAIPGKVAETAQVAKDHIHDVAPQASESLKAMSGAAEAGEPADRPAGWAERAADALQAVRGLPADAWEVFTNRYGAREAFDAGAETVKGHVEGPLEDLTQSAHGAAEAGAQHGEGLAEAVRRSAQAAVQRVAEPVGDAAGAGRAAAGEMYDAAAHTVKSAEEATGHAASQAYGAVGTVLRKCKEHLGVAAGGEPVPECEKEPVTPADPATQKPLPEGHGGEAAEL